MHHLDVHDESNDCNNCVVHTVIGCASKPRSSGDPCRAEDGRGLPAQVLESENPARHRMQ